MSEATKFNKQFETIHSFFVLKDSLDITKLGEEDRKKVVVVNAGNGTDDSLKWRLGGNGLNGACARLYNKGLTREFTDQERVFSLRSSDGAIGCDLLVVNGEQGFTHVYQVGPKFNEEQGIAKGEIHKLLFSNYATFLALMQPEIKDKSVVLAGASTNIFAGALKDIKRTENGVNIVNYINALCFIQFSESLKDNGLKIYMNSGLSTAMQDIQKNPQDVVNWIAEQIGDKKTLENLGITGDATSGYKLKAPDENSSQEFETHLLEKLLKEDKERLEEAKIISEIRRFKTAKNIRPFSCLSNEEVKFWREKYKQLNLLAPRKTFSQILKEAFEEVKKTHEGEEKDKSRENINALRNQLRSILELDSHDEYKNLFNPIFDEEKGKWKNLKFDNFLAYTRYLREGGEGKTYRTQTDLAVMRDFFEFKYPEEKKYHTTADGQKITVFTGKDGKKFVITAPTAKDEIKKIIEDNKKYLKKEIESNEGITLLIPATSGEHWTLYSITLVHNKKDNKIEVKQNTILHYNSTANERQKDGWSCGIHTMEAAYSLITGEKLKTGELVEENLDINSLLGSSQEKQPLSTNPTALEKPTVNPSIPAPKSSEPKSPESGRSVQAPGSSIQASESGDIQMSKSVVPVSGSDDISASGSVVPTPRSDVLPAPRNSEPKEISISSCVGQLRTILSTGLSGEYSTVKESLSGWVSNAKEVINSAFEYNVSDSEERTAERAQVLRAAITDTVLNGITQQIPVDIIKAFINGEKLDTKEKRDEVRPIIESQLSALPKSVRSPNPSKPKFPCKDKITLNEDGTTTVSFTFYRNQLKPNEDGRITIDIEFPKGVLVSPDLLDAIRAGKLKEYLNEVKGKLEDKESEADKQIAGAFLSAFSQNSKEVPALTA